MIELAPAWKRSLTLANPLVLSAGGYAPPDLTAASQIGALVTLPTTPRPRAGAPTPRVIDLPGGFLLRTGAANPGLAQVLHDYRRAWEKSPLPIIVALAAQDVRMWPNMAQRLEQAAGVAGVELHLNPTIDAAEAIRVTRSASELPILAKLDLENARDIAADCIAAGANALVIGRAPRAMKIIDGQPWYGRLFGPAVKPIALRAVAEIAALNLNAPLLACGGVHSADDVREFLAAGACAVEIDSASWIDPTMVARIAAELRT